MAIYSISDLHLSLATPKPMDVFGHRWQGYMEKLEKMWRAVVTDKDTVVVPGDISWAMRLDEALTDLRFIDSLPGKKLIGKGNHDYWWQTLTKMRSFLSSEGIDSIDFLFNNAYAVDGHIICGARGWFIEERLQSAKEADWALVAAREASRLKTSLEAAKVLQVGEAEDFPILVYLHFPVIFGDFVCEEMLDLLKEYGVKECFYGHIHGNYGVPAVTELYGIKHTIISADYLNFIPRLTAK